MPSNVELLNIDCMEYMKGLPDKSFDLIITDPPYGINFVSNYRNIKHKKIFGDNMFPLWIFEEFERIARNGAYVFCRWDNLMEIPKPKSVIAWVKNNWSMGDLKHEHGRQWEAIAFYPYHDHKFIKRIQDVINIKRTGNNLHPTEKPPCVIKILLEENEGKSVLDPFLGSGSTAIAAYDTRFDFVGCEIDKDYYDVAVKRFENHKKQLQLF